MATRSVVSLLWLLTALFLSRVLAQLIQYLSPVTALPEFAAWQGSALPYPLLLSSQLLILLVMVYLTRRCAAGQLERRPRTGQLLGLIGGVYFSGMLLRLLLGLTLYTDHAWFAKPLPAFFHLVLAGYILTLGLYHLSHSPISIQRDV